MRSVVLNRLSRQSGQGCNARAGKERRMQRCLSGRAQSILIRDRASTGVHDRLLDQRH
jgi:hypothetical protein